MIPWWTPGHDAACGILVWALLAAPIAWRWWSERRAGGRGGEG